jgi:hypothetical protein
MSVRDAIAAVEACESPEDLAAIQKALAQRMNAVAPPQGPMAEAGLFDGWLSGLKSVVSGISDPGSLPWPEIPCPLDGLDGLMGTEGPKASGDSRQGLLKAAWCSFMAANEVLEVVAAYTNLRTLCNVADDAFGDAAFEPVRRATLAEPSGVPANAITLLQYLDDRRKTYPSPGPSVAPRVVISGAGPCGLRAAVEAALLGMRAHVVEKRATFSRVNILMLWPQTADDMVGHGARECPGFEREAPCETQKRSGSSRRR